jgi:hypothetical protein
MVNRQCAWRWLVGAGAIVWRWIALYGGLGYVFAGQWETISDLAGDLTGALKCSGLPCAPPPRIGGTRRPQRWVAEATVGCRICT